MAFDAGTVRGELELEVAKFRSGIKRAEQALDRLDKEVKQNAASVSKWRDRLAVARDLLIVFPAVIKGVLAPLRGLFNLLRDSSTAAADFEQVVQNLSVSLAQAGVSNVQAVTEELKAYASSVQNATAHSDSLVLEVAQTLTAMGVQEDKLKENTKAVLDYSSAFGRNAVESAKLFGKSLSGNLGELSEALPALVGTSKEVLALGGAFDFAAEQFGGFSEQAAKTTKGLRAQLVNAFGDFQKEIGFAINPVLDAITQGAIEAVKLLQGVVEQNSESITTAFAGIAQGALQAIRSLLDKLVDVPVLLAQLRVFFAEARLLFAEGVDGAQRRLDEFFLRIKDQVAQLLLAFEGSILFSGLADAGAKIAGQVRVLREELEGAQAAADKQNEALAQARDKAIGAAGAAKQTAAAFRETGEATTDWQRTLVATEGVLGAVDDRLGSINDESRKTIDLAGGAEQSVRKALNVWRSVNEAAEETAGAAGSVARATDQATDSAERLADAAGRARSEFEGAASAAAGAGGGGGGGGSLFGGPTAGESRRAGGSAGFDLSTVEGAQAALDAARNAAGASVGGLFSRQARRSAFLVGQQVQQRLNALREQDVADFTRGVLEELNRSGIFDQQQRQDILTARIDEARRLGTLPRASTPLSQVGTVF